MMRHAAAEKRWDWGKAWYFLGMALLAWLVLGPVVAWLLGAPTPYRPREGDECGPGHHWVYVRTRVVDPDLPCEKDR